MDKNNLLIKRTIVVVIMVALLFTSGFVLGAVTAEIKELAPAVEQVPPTTESTTVPTTAAPTTQPPTTAAPTTEPTTETTTEATTETTTEATTEATTEETTEEEPCFLVKILLTLLDFKKQIIDFIISLLSSL